MKTLYEQDPNKQQRMIDAGETKECRGCAQELLIAEYYWQKAHNNPAARCKACWKSNQKNRYYTEPGYKERQVFYDKQYIERLGGKEAYNAQQRQRYATDDAFRQSRVESTAKYRLKKKNEKRSK